MKRIHRFFSLETAIAGVPDLNDTPTAFSRSGALQASLI
jgi:hypothetical protein